jgi:hypothetical protein
VTYYFKLIKFLQAFSYISIFLFNLHQPCVMAYRWSIWPYITAAYGYTIHLGQQPLSPVVYTPHSCMIKVKQNDKCSICMAVCVFCPSLTRRVKALGTWFFVGQIIMFQTQRQPQWIHTEGGVITQCHMTSFTANERKEGHTKSMCPCMSETQMGISQRTPELKYC